MTRERPGEAKDGQGAVATAHPKPDFDLPLSHASEWGIFNYDGCLERRLYGPEAVREAMERFSTIADAYSAPMCDCDVSGCECAQVICECGDGDD